MYYSLLWLFLHNYFLYVWVWIWSALFNMPYQRYDRLQWSVKLILVAREPQNITEYHVCVCVCVFQLKTSEYCWNFVKNLKSKYCEIWRPFSLIIPLKLFMCLGEFYLSPHNVYQIIVASQNLLTLKTKAQFTFFFFSSYESGNGDAKANHS